VVNDCQVQKYTLINELPCFWVQFSLVFITSISSAVAGAVRSSRQRSSGSESVPTLGDRAAVVSSFYSSHVRGKVPWGLRKSCPVCVDLKLGKKGGQRAGTKTFRLEYTKHSRGCMTCGILLCDNHWDAYHLEFMGRGRLTEAKVWQEL